MSGNDPKPRIEDLVTLDRLTGETAAPPSGAPVRTRPLEPGPDLEAGRSFGPYCLIRLLGRGGFGQVWEAESLETGRRVALKVLAHDPNAAPEILQRFEREARLAASLNHPHCVFVLSAERISGFPAITMELMPGGTLQDVLKEKGRLEVAQAVDYTLDVLGGLEAAHKAGILHRDLKPSNCFLDQDGRAKVGDFGLSKTIDVESDLSITGAFMGTPSYASPEQFRGRELDLRSDLYALGATLYALLTGKPPFEGKHAGDVMARILTEEPTPFAAHNVDVPRGLQAVVLRLLAKDPAKRLVDYDVLRATLLPFSSNGLTAGGLAQRFGAFLFDVLPFSLLKAAWDLAAFGSESGSLLRNALVILAFQLLYFSLCEGLWGRTPGKALFGLRVTGAAGAGVGLGRALLRAAVFLGLYKSGDLLTLARMALDLPMGRVQQVVFGLLQLAGTIAPLVTMRRRNGYAGLHEIASGTRVRVVRPDDRAAIPAAAAPQPAKDSRGFGPYRETGAMWEEPEASLLVAEDLVLKRKVWIHRFADVDQAPPLAEMAGGSAGALRWLQGSRAPGGCWDAYEAPSGTSLWEWVKTHGPLPWRATRGILLGLARSLESRGASSRELSVARLWIDGQARVRLLVFPVSAGAPTPAFAPDGWREFVHHVAVFCLEGRLAPPAELAGRTATAPMPEHARPFLRRICRVEKPFENLQDLVAELRELMARRAAVTRLQRLVTLLIPAVCPLLMLGMAVVGGWAMQRMMPEYWRDFLRVEAHVKTLQRLGSETGEDAQRQREAIRILLAASYTQVKRSHQGAPMLTFMPDETRVVLEDAVRAYPSPTPEQVVEARQNAPGLKERRFQTLGSGVSFSVSADERLDATGVVTGLFRLAGALALPAVLCAPLVRGGILLHLLGMTVQGSGGARVGRGRCLLRAAAAWMPFFFFSKLAGQFGFDWTPLAMPGALVTALGVAGVVYAIARPERGLPDVIVGTRLTPR